MNYYQGTVTSEIEQELFKEIYKELYNAGIICIPTSSDFSTIAFSTEDEYIFEKIRDQVCSKYLK